MAAVAERLKSCLKKLPRHHYPVDVQTSNVIRFLSRFIQDKHINYMDESYLTDNFPNGDYQSNSLGWDKACSEGLIDWTGDKFVLNRSLLAKK
jgi:hypothetical protein